MAKAVLILSGGLDSTTLMYDLLNKGIEVHAVSFFYGQKHSKELECAHALCDKLNVPHKIIDLEVLNYIAPSALTRSEIEVPEGQYDSDNMKATVGLTATWLCWRLHLICHFQSVPNYVDTARMRAITPIPGLPPQVCRTHADAIASALV